MRVALRLGGFRVVAEELGEGCHGDGHALHGRQMRADHMFGMWVNAGG